MKRRMWCPPATGLPGISLPGISLQAVGLLAAGLLAAGLLTIQVHAQEAKTAFSGEAAWSYVRDLASDGMEGRLSGHPGAARAEEYIASRFREWGLEPAGDDGTFFQNFTIEHNYVLPGVVLEITTELEKRSFQYGEDWRALPFSGSGHFMTEVVFAGYGIHAPEKGYDDYSGLDARGKFVLITGGFPARRAGDLEEEGTLDNRIMAAQQSGAVGLLFHQPASGTGRASRLRPTRDVYDPAFVILTGEQNVARLIFEDLDADLNNLLSQINSTSEPRSFSTGVMAFVSVNAGFDPQRATRNVLARIPGTDRQLREETVVIGAHMDHMGIDPYGFVQNGANDNASGTAVVMEVARAMKLNGVRPRRTIVFAGWAGEEQQILGSLYYLEHPPYPMEKTVACINMDMVGQGSGNVRLTCVNYAAEIWEIVAAKLPEEILGYVEPGWGEPGPSDHTGFLAMGVPSFYLMTAGSHLKTHRRGDDVDLIKPELLKRTGDLVYAATEIIASEQADLILPERRENYYMKYLNLIDYCFPTLDAYIDQTGEMEERIVNLQLALLPETSELPVAEARALMIQHLLHAEDRFSGAPYATPFTSGSSIGGSALRGKTAVMAGIEGIALFLDDPKWVRVPASLGAGFILVEGDELFGSGDSLGETEREVLAEINANGLLLIAADLTGEQARDLLNASSKPVVLLDRDPPDAEMLKLIKETGSALGLILSRQQAPSDYFEKLDTLLAALGEDHLMVVNEQSLEEGEGKQQMLGVISEMLKAGYEHLDNYLDFTMNGLFSGTFLRVLEASR
ncbi:M28 family peptidase [Gemmatimonadota bacterium]